MGRRASRVDDNQRDVVDGLRRMGCTVQHLHKEGMGCPDLLIGWRGRNWLFEVKDGAKPPSARTLTEMQKRWHMEWRGQVSVIHTAEEALAIMQSGSVEIPIMGAVIGDKVVK